MAPETCIDPAPATSAKLDEKLEGQWNHAVVFAASPLFTHELYPLAVDAFERDSNKYGKVYFNILGVHVDWFAPDGKILRLLYLDFANNALANATWKFHWYRTVPSLSVWDTRSTPCTLSGRLALPAYR